MTDNELVLRIPHSLGAAEAQRRIASGIDAAKSQYGPFLRGAETTWNENRMNFRLFALAQTVQGRIDVDEHFVELRAQLPLVMRLLAKRFLPTIENTGRKLISP